MLLLFELSAEGVRNIDVFHITIPFYCLSPALLGLVGLNGCVNHVALTDASPINPITIFSG